MIVIRHSNQRGRSQQGWLDSFHTFSFDRYYDPQFMGFSHLRVINEDFIQPSQGFGTHPHRDMEIITYVVTGSLQHQDSLGNGSVIKPGEIQRMSAGTGIRHSEVNSSAQQVLHLLQIWIKPNEKNLPPSYEQKYIQPSRDQLILIAANQHTENSVYIHQDVKLYTAFLSVDKTIDYQMNPQRHIWLQVIKGSIQLQDEVLNAGDAAAITEQHQLSFKTSQATELLLFDLE